MTERFEKSLIVAGFKEKNSALVQANIQPKGGVGKTTETIHEGCYAAEIGLRVLLIDQDQSCNMTESFLDQETALSVANVKTLYAADSRNIEELKSVRPTRVRTYELSGGFIDLLPSYPDLSFADSSSDPSMLNRLKLWLIKAEINKQYDLIIIDNPGHFASLNMSAMTAAHFWLSPLEMTEYGRQGIIKILEYVESIRDFNNPNLKSLGCIPFKVDKQHKSYKEMQKKLIDSGLAEYLLDGFEVEVFSRAAVRAAVDLKLPVWEYNQADDGAKKAGLNMRFVMNHVLAKMLGMTEK